MELNLRGIADFNGKFNTYCNGCEFSDWCNRENKSFKLKTTIEAFEHYLMSENGSITQEKKDINYKNFQYSLIVERMIEEEKKKV